MTARRSPVHGESDVRNPTQPAPPCSPRSLPRSPMTQCAWRHQERHVNFAARTRTRAVHFTAEMSTPQPKSAPAESLELPVEELLRRGQPHVPYGEQVIDDLTPEEADAFLEAVRS